MQWGKIVFHLFTVHSSAHRQYHKRCWKVTCQDEREDYIKWKWIRHPRKIASSTDFHIRKSYRGNCEYGYCFSSFPFPYLCLTKCRPTPFSLLPAWIWSSSCDWQYMLRRKDALTWLGWSGRKQMKELLVVPTFSRFLNDRSEVFPGLECMRSSIDAISSRSSCPIAPDASQSVLKSKRGHFRERVFGIHLVCVHQIGPPSRSGGNTSQEEQRPEKCIIMSKMSSRKWVGIHQEVIATASFSSNDVAFLKARMQNQRAGRTRTLGGSIATAQLILLSLQEEKKEESKKRENRTRPAQNWPRKRRCRKVTWFSGEIPSILRIFDLALIDVYTYTTYNVYT